VLADDFVRNRVAGERNGDHVTPGAVNGLSDRLRYLIRLARGKAHTTVAIADGNQCVEGEAATAFHDLGDAVDGDDILDELTAFTLTTALTAARFASSTFAATATSALSTSAATAAAPRTAASSAAATATATSTTTTSSAARTTTRTLRRRRAFARFGAATSRASHPSRASRAACDVRRAFRIL
jgi:hypothetical protein